MRLNRALAMAATAVLAGVGLVAATATPASAAITVNVPSGNDLSLFNVSVGGDISCPAGTGDAIFAAEGPGSDFQTNGEGFIGQLAGADTVDGIYTTPNQSIANLRTATATFGTGPFPQSYAINLYCDGLPPVQQIATLTLSGIGQSGTTFTLVPVSTGPVAATTTTTLSVSPSTTVTLPVGGSQDITVSATVAPSAAGTVTFTGPGAPAAPVAVVGGVASFTTTIAAAGISTYNASFASADTAAFTNSTSAPVTVTATVAAEPASATATAIAVSGGSPLTALTSGGTATGPITPVRITGTVTDTTAPITTPTGTCEFRNGTVVLGTAPVAADGTCFFESAGGLTGAASFTVTYVPSGNFTGSTSSAFTYTFAGVNVCALTTGTSPLYTDTSGANTPFTGSQCVDPQVVKVEVPAGNLIISTPYTAANPFDLGILQLNSTGTAWSITAPFGSETNPALGVSITDTRPGNQPFTAQASATDFASGTGGTIGAALLSFDAPTARYITGNRLNGVTGPTTVTTTAIPAFSLAPATFATGTGPGSVFVTGILTLDNVPTSVPAGVYTSTVTFTIA